MGPPIFTLDARGNIMLELMQSYLGLSPTRLLSEINAMFATLLKILKAKDIEYASLKNALIPHTDRNEAAFVFDRTRIKSDGYGCEVFERVLPALDQDATLSVLCGDVVGENNMQDRLYEAFGEEVTLVRPCTWTQSNQFFVVYINNLSDNMLANMQSCMSRYAGFVGWADCCGPSFLKTYFSLILCNSFLKAREIIIQGHEDDRDNTEDVDMTGYPFEEYGYKCKSLQSMYNDLFLHYKIERAVYPGLESDTLFSLNAISDTVVPFDQCEVEVEEAKLEYLQKEKAGSMKKSGLLYFGKEELQAKIRERLASNYIFNMAYVPQHATMKFNTILNFKPKDTKKLVRLTVSLEYKPSEKLVRLITMF
jgi:hypothetical protein